MLGVVVANLLLLFLHQKIDCQMFKKMRQGSADHLIAKQTHALLFTGVLSKRRSQGKYSVGKLFSHPGIWRQYTNSGAH